MSEKNMKVRMRQVFTDEEMRRISVNVTDSKATVIADVHGMGCLQARVFISNVIALFLRRSVVKSIPSAACHGMTE